MRSACCRNPLAAYLFTIATVFNCGGPSPADTDEPMRSALLGSWEHTGKVIVFSADGTGTNYDATRFHWELTEGRLIARRQAPVGTLGDEWSILIVFTKDRKEFSYLLGAEDGGLQRVTFHKLDPDGRRFGERTDADRAYPPNAEALKGEGPPEESAPKPEPKPVRPRPAKAPGGEAIIRVGPNVQVSKERDTIDHGEVKLAADPHDPKRLLAGSMFQPPPVDSAAPKTVVLSSRRSTARHGGPLARSRVRKSSAVIRIEHSTRSLRIGRCGRWLCRRSRAGWELRMGRKHRFRYLGLRNLR
jgi:hypothetical protein